MSSKSTSSVSTGAIYSKYIFVFIPVIFWGISFISTKILLNEMTPAMIAITRQIIAAICLLVYVILTRASLKIKFKDLLLLAFSCCFGIVLYFIFENTGLLYTSSSNAAIIVATVPIFTMISETIFFRKQFHPKTLIFIAISIIGVYLVVSDNGKLDFSSQTMYGNLLVLGAMISWVIYTILSRKLSNTYNGTIINFYQTVISCFIFIPFIIRDVPKQQMISPIAIINLLFLGIFCSALSYFMYLHSVRITGATVSSAFLNLIPVVTVISGFLLLGERLTLLQLAGVAVVIFGIWQVNRNS